MRCVHRQCVHNLYCQHEYISIHTHSFIVVVFDCLLFVVYHMLLFITSSDGCLYEWDLATGTCVRYLRGHSRPVTTIQVSVHQSIWDLLLNVQFPLVLSER